MKFVRRRPLSRSARPATEHRQTPATRQGDGVGTGCTWGPACSLITSWMDAHCLSSEFKGGHLSAAILHPRKRVGNIIWITSCESNPCLGMTCHREANKCVGWCALQMSKGVPHRWLADLVFILRQSLMRAPSSVCCLLGGLSSDRPSYSQGFLHHRAMVFAHIAEHHCPFCLAHVGLQIPERRFNGTNAARCFPGEGSKWLARGRSSRRCCCH